MVLNSDKLKKILLSCISGILVIGCTMVVDLDVPFNNPGLVVNSFFSADSVWQVEVSHSRFILENHRNSEFRMEENAKVEIFEDDKPLGLLEHKGNGIYASSEKKPEMGRSYKIRVESPGYPVSEGSDRLPSEVPIQRVEVSRFETANDNDLRRLRLTIDDPAGENNFYLLTAVNVETLHGPNNTERYVLTRTIRLGSSDPAQVGPDPQTSEMGYFNDGILFTDRLFDGKQYVMTVEFEKGQYEYSTLERNPNHQYYASGEYVFYLLSLSEASYRYHLTFAEQNKAKRDGNPFVEPLPVFSNMSNRAGIFGGYSIDRAAVRYNELELEGF